MCGRNFPKCKQSNSKTSCQILCVVTVEIAINLTCGAQHFALHPAGIALPWRWCHWFPVPAVCAWTSCFKNSFVPLVVFDFECILHLLFVLIQPPGCYFPIMGCRYGHPLRGRGCYCVVVLSVCLKSRLRKFGRSGSYGQCEILSWWCIVSRQFTLTWKWSCGISYPHVPIRYRLRNDLYCVEWDVKP